MGNKRLDQLSAGLFESWGAAEVRGVRFDQYGIEVVLADEHTQPVSQFGLTVIRPVLMRWLYGLSLFSRWIGRTGKPAQLLNRTEPDSVGLAQSAIDGPRFGNAHLSATDKGRRICGVSVAVADEPLRQGILIDGGLENPSIGVRVRQAVLNCCFDTRTAPPLSDAKQRGVCDVPASIQELQISG